MSLLLAGPSVVRDIFSIVQQIRDNGVTILLIEQNANVALHIADYGYVLETGNVVLSGRGRELLENEEVKSAYLGKKKQSSRGNRDNPFRHPIWLP